MPGEDTTSTQSQHRGVAPSGVQTWRCSLRCGASCSHGVRKPCGVAGCGVKTRRGVTCPPCVREPAGRWRRGMELYQGARQWPHLALQAVASERGVTCSGGAESLWRPERGVRRHRPTRRRNTWHQYLASGDAGLPVRVFNICLQSSGDMCTLQATTLFTLQKSRPIS